MKKTEETSKLEPAFLAQHEDVLADAGYYRQRANTAPSNHKGGSSKGFNRTQNKWNKSSNSKEYHNNRSTRPVNPKASDGKIITCKDCGSYRYLVKDCQHSYERKKDEANLTDTYPADDNNMSQECCHFTSDVEENDFEIERFILFTSDDKEMSKFTSEALNKAALDTCCTLTVAGEKWMKHYLSSLPHSMKQKVKGPYQGKRCFQFGNQGTLKSTAKYFLPAIIAEKEVMIEVDVIPSDIPMLLSKAEMKKSNMVLYMLEDKVEVLGKSLNLDTTSSGHYLLPLIDESINIQEIFSINLKEANDEEKAAALKNEEAAQSVWTPTETKLHQSSESCRRIYS